MRHLTAHSPRQYVFCLSTSDPTTENLPSLSENLTFAWSSRFAKSLTPNGGQGKPAMMRPDSFHDTYTHIQTHAAARGTHLLGILLNHVNVIQILRADRHIEDTDDICVPKRLEDRNLAESGDGNPIASVGIEDADLLERDDSIGEPVKGAVDYTVGFVGGEGGEGGDR